MQPSGPMKLSKNTTNTIKKVLQGVIAAAPAIPYLLPKRRNSIAAYVIGGIGFAVAGGLATLMFLSPRTRNRALNVAKDTYSKVNGRIGSLRERQDGTGAMANGIVDRGDEYSATTGL